MKESAGNARNGVWSYIGRTATFNPSSDLSYSTTYTVTVGATVKDSWNALGASSWGFTTKILIQTIQQKSPQLCAFSDFTVKCWNNNYGQLGDGLRLIEPLR